MTINYTPMKSGSYKNSKMGFSFSASWENLKFVYGLHKNRAKNKPVDNYLILSETDIPEGLASKRDEGNSGHYFLAVTERMKVEPLVEKLRFVSYRMSVMKERGGVL